MENEKKQLLNYLLQSPSPPSSSALCPNKRPISLCQAALGQGQVTLAEGRRNEEGLQGWNPELQRKTKPRCAWNNARVKVLDWPFLFLLHAGRWSRQPLHPKDHQEIQKCVRQVFFSSLLFWGWKCLRANREKNRERIKEKNGGSLPDPWDHPHGHRQTPGFHRNFHSCAPK